MLWACITETTTQRRKVYSISLFPSFFLYFKLSSFVCFLFLSFLSFSLYLSLLFISLTHTHKLISRFILYIFLFLSVSHTLLLKLPLSLCNTHTHTHTHTHNTRTHKHTFSCKLWGRLFVSCFSLSLWFPSGGKINEGQKKWWTSVDINIVD